MVVELLSKLDMANGGSGAPTVVTPGQRWIFRGYIPNEGGEPQAGEFKVNGGALTTYNIGSVIGGNDNPSIDLTASPHGAYLFEYNIEQCDIGTLLTLTNNSCPTCNAGSSVPITVCNGSCTVNLFQHLTGDPDAGGAWSQVSGPQTLTFSGGDLGTVNFSGKTAGTYVARYTVLFCTVDITITVIAPPNAGIDKTVDRCDSDGTVVNFETEVGGTPGTWTATSVLPSFGVVDIPQKKYTPADGDGGIPAVYGTAKTYTFQKTVQATGVVSECANSCNDTADLTVRVYPRFTGGQSSLNNTICNDGSSRNLRDLLTGEESGGVWDVFAVVVDGQSVSNVTLLINGVSTNINVIAAPQLFGGADNGTVGFPPGTAAGEYRFRYKLPNQNTICGPSPIPAVSFLVQSCGSTCNGNNPTIVQTITGNCVKATRGGSLSSTIATEVWTYRLSNNGAFQAYTPNTDVCGQAYVEFKYVLTFTNSCPAIEKSTVYNQNNPNCSNSPTVSASFNTTTCQFTITPGGTTNSPISTSNLQWRYLGNTPWNTYSAPITISGAQTIEYRRIVSYSDGCDQTTTSIQQITGQCSSSCNVSIGVNANNNLLSASVTGCGSISQTINWYFSANNTTYGSSIGTGNTYTPTTDGYYKAVVVCGNCTDFDIFQYTTGPAPCEGTASISFASNVLTASRTGCTGVITYTWQYSASGSGWTSATGNLNQNTLVPQDGPGSYRVITFCNGNCPLEATYVINQAQCNNTPTISCNFNTSTCQYTLTPGGTNQSAVANDAIWWKQAGSTNIHQYSGPFVFNGNIEFQRTVQYFDGCPDVNTPWTICSGVCCNGNSIDVNCQFNQGTCQFTLVPVTNVTSQIINDQIRWRATGTTTWNAYTGPFAAPSGGNIQFDRTVVFADACATLITPVKSCSGSCCTGNSPTVAATFNTQTCQYTITAGGTNTSTMQTDALEWRETGSTGNYIMYNGPFAGPASIEVRRRVTYTNGCTATVPGSATGTCCNGNNPGVTCSYNNTTCLFTLNSTGTLTSPITSDIKRWRSVGSTIWQSYSAPFANNGQIEYYREVVFSNGCSPLSTAVQQCNGVCCTGNNGLDVTCAFNGTDCKYTLTRTGANVSQIASDVVEYRAVGSGTWLPYSVPVSVSGNIEYRRTVTFTDGCANVQTSTKTCTGACCLGNSPTVSCGYSQSTCLYTLTPGGSVASPIATDVVYWRNQGSTLWNTYSAPFANAGQIEYYRQVNFSNGCSPAATSVQVCSGTCCSNNAPDASCSFNGADCKYTLTKTGTIVSPTTSDQLEWRPEGSGGGWTLYSAPFTQVGNIEYRRVVDFSDTCSTITTTTKTCSGTCCTGNNPTVGCSYNNSTCTFTLTTGGTIVSPIATDKIYYRTSGSSVFIEYTAPFVNTANIEYYRVVTFSNGCASASTGIQTCGGVCCTNNTPDVVCAFSGSTCLFTLTKTGTLVSPTSSDIVQWRAVGSGTWNTYSTPVSNPSGNIEFRRVVVYSDGCSTYTGPVKTCVGACCANNTIGVSHSFNSSNCQHTITLTGTSNTAISTDVTEWRQQGSSGAWTTYSGPFTGPTNIDIRRTVVYVDACQASTTGAGTGLCCLGNTPGVSCSKNSGTCTYTLNPTGSNTSPIATDVIQWRVVGQTAWNTYSGPFVNTSNIEYRRIVTYSDGCASVTTSIQTCSGNCCITNLPDANCSFNAGNCQFTLSNAGTVTSAIATDRIEWRDQGSSDSWTTYSGPFTNNTGVEYRRVITFSDGCAGITTTVKNCNGTCCLGNSPGVSCSQNPATCGYTLTPTGSSASPIATDVIQWRPAGTSNWNNYSSPFTHNGGIEYRRTVTYTNGCASVTTSVQSCSGVCCTTNAPDVTCSFNATDCKFTLSNAGTNTSAITSDIIEWRTQGSGGSWNTYSVPFTNSQPIEFRRTVNYSDACADITTAVKTCNGLCCLNNNPGVTCSWDNSTCRYTLTPTGSSTSPIATDVIQWKQTGSLLWQNYSAPLFGVNGQIDYKRTVTYSDGCAQKVTAVQTCNGVCCTTNLPDASCSFNANDCHYSLNKIGTVTSTTSSDVLQWRNQGSGGSWNTYSAPFQNGSAIEFRRVLAFTDGCAGITTTVKNCSGTCCQGNNPDVDCSYNTSTCRYTLTASGTNASPVASDVIQWRPELGTVWQTYPPSGLSYNGPIEFRRVVTYSNGCPGVTTSVNSCLGICCTGNVPDVTCQFDNQTCKYTLVKTGNSTSFINVDTIYWRPTGSGSYSVYSVPFSHNGGIDYYRVAQYGDGCATVTTTVKSCTGACCGTNTPGIQCSFNPSDCKYTLTNTGTNTSTVSTDVKEWRQLGSTGSWTTYSVPFTGPAQIEARRVVTYTDSCVANAQTTCGGNCCTGNSPGASCAYSNTTCLYTLTNSGTVSSPTSSDIIRWRPVGTTNWNTYNGPFANSGQIEYQRVVTFSNGCAQIITTLQACNGLCCALNTPDVNCFFNSANCTFSLNRVGTNASSVNTDIVEYRLVGAGSWTTYSSSFSNVGDIEFRRTVTYTDGCATVVSAIKTCSGNCCDGFSVTAATNYTNITVQASGSPCAGGTLTYQWYYGTTAGNTNTFLGNGTSIPASMGTGYYQVRAFCTVGNCQTSHTVLFTCQGTASLSTSLTTLTVTGLASCPNPSYQWQYSPNGSSGWVTATGSGNSASLTMQNGNGWYRVTILCYGNCPIALTYQRDCNCTNNPISVSAVKTTDFIVTATPTGCVSGTTYTWTASNGGQINGGQGTNQISTNGKGTYQVSVQCNNGCGQSCSAVSNPVNLCNCVLEALLQHYGTNYNSMQVILGAYAGTISYAWTATGNGGVIIGASNGAAVTTNGIGSYQVIITSSDCGSNLCQRILTWNWSTKCPASPTLVADCCELKVSATCGLATSSGNIFTWQYSPNGSSGWTDFTWSDFGYGQISIPTGGSVSNVVRSFNSQGQDPLGNCTGYYRYQLTCGCGAQIYSNVVFVNCCNPCTGCACLSPTILSITGTGTYNGSNISLSGGIQSNNVITSLQGSPCKFPMVGQFRYLNGSGAVIGTVDQTSINFNIQTNVTCNTCPGIAQYFCAPNCTPPINNCLDEEVIYPISLFDDNRVGGVTNFNYSMQASIPQVPTVKFNGVNQTVNIGVRAAFPTLGIWYDNGQLTVRVSGVTGTLEIKRVMGSQTFTLTHTW